MGIVLEVMWNFGNTLQLYYTQRECVILIRQILDNTILIIIMHNNFSDFSIISAGRYLQIMCLDLKLLAGLRLAAAALRADPITRLSPQQLPAAAANTYLQTIILSARTQTFHFFLRKT